MVKVVGVGNAIVDVIADADDTFLTERSLAKGAMTLIGEDQAATLYDAMGPGRESSGGSAANTIAGLASFGSEAAFIGKVKNDQLGTIFRHDIRALGVTFDTPPAEQANDPSTARCLIFVTPDAQRTMCTFLGVSVTLGPDDVHANLIQAADVTYLEGYLWDPEEAKAAFRKAMELAHAANRRVAFTLSDSFCVDRHRTEFKHLVEDEIDILFANEHEICSLYEVESFDEALQAVRGKVEIAALTRSEKGSVIVAGEEIHVIDAAPVNAVVDTTGAGDLFAAGFLHGLTNGRPLHDCAQLGGLAAAEVISHYGARPDVSLKDLAASHGL